MLPRTVEIRPARPADAAAIARLLEQLSANYRTTPGEVVARLETLAPDTRHAVLVATDAEGSVVGWVDVASCDSLIGIQEAIVYGLVVEQSTRGTGVGRKLMEAAEQWARRQGCPGLRLRTNVIRQQAHAFYEHLGYELLKTQRIYRKKL